MKCVVALLLISLGGTALGQDKPNNGSWWAGLSPDYKLGFVHGFSNAMTSLSDLRSFQCLERKKQSGTLENVTACLQSPDVVNYDYGGIPMGQFADGVDALYKDPRNQAIDIRVALKYVRDKLKGKSTEVLEQELKTFRGLTK